ncbi:amine oxidase [Coprinopsis cinerea okayama7|uniref:Amine oxidase n=1 Tax=Coprinopsis cinerea (strain Okayama-7 / 130 / ATCC MYA-4618 / FGSC 9003) TaxID=240176 RepID=A8NQB5_COPC7|nr:amine oxidase [Coprinopsis cinerea okayama7\|eukprot:XP_001835520.1 amine oxidase [Coprinopsis cinerea okayama7\
MKVAIVGSGVSGLAATWLLNEHSEHTVHLYEADTRPGGHANTVRFVPPGAPADSDGIDVDTGFIVMNPPTYPNFLRFLKLHEPKDSDVPSQSQRPLNAEDNPTGKTSGIKVVPTEMTFSVSSDNGAFEWAGKNLFTVFCQPRRLLDPLMWRMVYDIFRFNACSRKVLMQKDESGTELSIGDYLVRENYSVAFRDNYLIPMTAAIWSTPPGKCFLDFPAKTLIQFMYNHHLLQITGKPSWLTIEGGSHRYVNQILSKLPSSQLHLNTPVVRASTSTPEGATTKPKVTLRTQAGDEVEYDHVILACHSDTALQILQAGNITPEEERILGTFQWNRNEVVLHSDVRMMPKSKMAWSCWNYLTTSQNGESSDIDRVSLTYGMNDLQHIPESKWGPVLCTLNPPLEPAPDKVVGRWRYDHPVLDSKAVQAQNEMPHIQNKRSITFAGAYLKYGFHEDGFTSGLLAACAIDEEPGQFPQFTYSPRKSNRRRKEGEDGLIIPVRRRTVKPPFEIRYADHHLALEREGRWSVENVLAGVFDVFERTGLRALVGGSLGVVLWVFGLALGMGKQMD